MNRLIKFRIWDKQNKLFCNPNLNIFINGKCLGLNDIFSDDNYIFQQFSGIKDKDGAEVYEGDVISGEFYHKTGLVTFRDFRFFVSSNKEHLHFSSIQNLKVIGNIFNKPELIK